MIQSAPASSALGNRYSIQQQVEQQSTYSLHLCQDQLKGDTCLAQELVASSETQATVLAQHIDNEAKSFLNWEHPQFEQIRDCFVKGESITLIKDHVVGQTYKTGSSFSEAALRPVLESLLAALSRLHSRGLSHRNISPDTILLQPDDNPPKLVQFGFVRDVLVELGAIASHPSLTKQAKALTGQPSPSNVTEDLYALALTSIILLTGKDLSELYNVQTQSWNWEDYQLVTDSLSQAIGRMLCRNESDRFTSADDFLAALQAQVSLPTTAPTIAPTVTAVSQPASPQPVSSTAQLASTAVKQQYQRNKGLTIAAGVSASALLATLAFFVLRGKPQPKFVVPLDSGSNAATATNDSTENRNSTSSISGLQATTQQGSTQTRDQSLSTSTEIAAIPENTAASLTEGEAVSLIQNWIESKRQIFASPFDRELAGSLSTGKLYYDITKPGGSIDWLRENGAYYKFGTQEVVSKGNFSASGDRASITVDVTEDRTLYVRGRIDRSSSGFNTSQLRYEFLLENGVWKIEDYE